MVQSIVEPEQAARKLMQEAYQRGSADNITCIVVRFLGDDANSAAELQASVGNSAAELR